MNDEPVTTAEVPSEPATSGSEGSSGASEPVSAPVALQLDSTQWETLSGSLALSNGLLLTILLAFFACLGSLLVGHLTQGWRR